MYTASIIIRQQPKITEYLKRETDKLIEELVSRYGDMEFLFSEKGEYEKCLLAAVDKVRKGNLHPKPNVIAVWMTEEPMTECSLDGISFDQVELYSPEEWEKPCFGFSAMQVCMAECCDFFLYYAEESNKEYEVLVHDMWRFRKMPLNLHYWIDPKYDHSEK